MIIKVQRSVTTTKSAQQVCVYNKSRTVFHKQGLTPEIEKLFRKDEMKFYAKAKYHISTNTVSIIRRVKKEDW